VINMLALNSSMKGIEVPVISFYSELQSRGERFTLQIIIRLLFGENNFPVPNITTGTTSRVLCTEGIK
jgi:hypothetical protein